MIKKGDLVYRHSYGWGKYLKDYAFKVIDVSSTDIYLPLIEGHIAGNGGNSRSNIKKLPKVKRVIKVTNQTMFDALDKYYRHLGHNLPSGNSLSNKVIGDYLVECEGNQIFYSYTDLGLPVIEDTDFVKTVGVKFRPDGKIYHYFANGIDAVVGGLVLVKGYDGSDNWLKVIEMSSKVFLSPKATKQVLAYVKPGGLTAVELPKGNLKYEVVSALQVFEQELSALGDKLKAKESAESKLVNQFDEKIAALGQEISYRLEETDKKIQMVSGVSDVDLQQCTSKVARLDDQVSKLIEENAKLRLDFDTLTQYNQADQKQSLFNQICRGWF